MNKFRRTAVMACAVAVVATVLPTAAAQAATETTYSGCTKVRDADTYATHATSQVTTGRGATSTTREVQLNTFAYGKTFDCGPAGRAFSVPTLTVSVEWRIVGSRLSCTSFEVGGGTGGATASITCGSSNTEATVKDSYTCKKKSACSVTYTPLIIRAASGGKINSITAKSTVKFSGPDGSQDTSAIVTGYPFS